MARRLRRLCLLASVAFLVAAHARAEDGYEVWLRYTPVSDAVALDGYRAVVSSLLVAGESPTARVVREELGRGLQGLLDGAVPGTDAVGDGTLLVGTPASSTRIAGLGLEGALAAVGDEGYLLRSMRLDGSRVTVIASRTDVGLLYGAFHFLRLLQTHRPIDALSVDESPGIRYRLLNHWDDLDGTVERGYAGGSLWNWHTLPGYAAPRYRDYARINASIGINGTVLTNVNADATVLTPEYLRKVAALADVFRPYGIKVYLTARFSAPIEIGGLATADPRARGVQDWWRAKADEIYGLVPDFGGFLVKADSEGQPGPHEYGRTHAEAANMLAEALAPHGGVVMWRAFVYAAGNPEDRAKQAYDEFTPLDGRFHPNVLLQVKNGPIDFQPREPVHPLFGAMPGTPLMLELQVTKEYLGFATHLVYLAPLFEEVLGTDTHARGAGSTVRRIVDGSLDGHDRTGIAGVANTGTDRNWCGSVFACANWHAFGRLAWDPALASAALADEWLRMTFTSDPTFLKYATVILLGSRQAAVDYMTPLGLHHLMARGHHYGPGPWVSGGPRADWTSVYYHRADEDGIGFDRTATGSNAVEQYAPPVRDLYGSLARVPDDYLLWFHHVPWDHRMSSGRTLWEELVFRYCRGVQAVASQASMWGVVERRIDAERAAETRAFFRIHAAEARWWREASVLYFQTFAKRPIEDMCVPPPYGLEHYMAIDHRYVPG